MAINYTQLFGDAGKLIKSIDLFRNAATSTDTPKPDLPALQTEIETQLIASGRLDVLEGLGGQFESWKNSLASWCDSLANRIDDRFNHRETVVNELPSLVQLSSIDLTLAELARQMGVDSESVPESTVGIGSFAFSAVNNGNGTIMLTPTLDGYNSPVNGGRPQPHYVGTRSELAVPSETMSVTCVQDEDTNGLSEGAEMWRFEGQPALSSPWDWETEGSGTSVTLPTLNAYDIIQNRDFEIFGSDNTPTGWEIESGIVGSDLNQETDSSKVYRGLSSMRFAGDTTGAAEMRQLLGGNALQPLRQYAISVAILGTASWDGDLTIELVSDSGGYTAPVGEKIEVLAATIAGTLTYTHKTAYIMAPATMPDDLQLSVKFTGASAGEMWIDSIAFGPVVYGNGIGIAMIAGSNQWVIDDRVVFSVTNSESKWQRYFRRRHKIQMPSDPSPTILDSLAE